MVIFYSPEEPVADCLDHAVILAQCGQGWIYVRRSGRNTWEWPGGHVKPGESVLDCAVRELQEETGACRYALMPVAPFARRDTDGGKVRLGALFFARVYELGSLPSDSEIGEVCVNQSPPGPLTYQEATAALSERAAAFLRVGWLVTPQGATG
jgi:8-oxo-dGTP diphosphatase